VVNSFKELGNRGVFSKLQSIQWEMSFRNERSVGINCAVLFSTQECSMLEVWLTGGK